MMRTPPTQALAAPAPRLHGLAADAQMRIAPWVLGLAALAFATLLLSFEHVVSQGVTQGESRRQAVRAHDSTAWRCNFLRERTAVERCLLLDAAAKPAPAP